MMDTVSLMSGGYNHDSMCYGRYSRINGIVDTRKSMEIQWTQWNSGGRRINGDTVDSME